MSETTTNTSDACELVLDYVYGELDEARKRTFEEHLPGCARCQQEVASFGKVRAAVKRVMPAVEPTAALGSGALHAQLMHAAAQRKPRRGVLLAFPRKIMQHPALSAAAMFVLVGGAIAINWSRGKLAMPATEHGAAQSPATATPPTPEEDKPADAPKVTEAAKAEPAVAEPLAAAKPKEQNEALGYKGGFKAGDKAADARTVAKPAAGEAGGGADETKLALETPTGPMAVRPVPHRAAPSSAAPSSAASTGALAKTVVQPNKGAPPSHMKSIAVDGKRAKLDADDGLYAAKDKKNAENDNGLGSVSGGVYGAGGAARGAPTDNVKSSAPQEIGRTVAEKAPARDEESASPKASTRRYDAPSAPPPAPPAATPAPVMASSPESEREGKYHAQMQQPPAGSSSVQKPAANLRNYDVQRKQADELAKGNRCDEAIKLYTELDKTVRLTPTERVNWVRCLNQRGRMEEAQQRLDELKQEKGVSNSQIQDAERNMSDTRKRYPVAKKAKKSPSAADRAPSVTTESVQQRAAEPPPAQAAPPDSTNTKIQKPAY